jgi:hypothetical protein
MRSEMMATMKRAAERIRKATVGMPGTMAKSSSTPDTSFRARGWLVSWPMNSSPMRASAAARLTMRPAEVEVISDGMVETRPSPMVSREKVWAASIQLMSFMQHADEDAADDVDEGDEHARVDVSGHELARAVHGSVEVRFPAQVFALLDGLLLVDEAGVQVGLDGHLLAGHGVQGEAGRDFGDAGRAGDDDGLVQDEEDEEDDRADGEIAADHEFPKAG